MADKSPIEWTDATWNPTVGCEIVSPGCKNCYAMPMARRCEAMGILHYAGTTRQVNGHTVWTGQINLAPAHILSQPLRWTRARKIFVNSMSDLFAEGVPDAVIDRVFAVMALSPQHTFQVLTKRPDRMRAYFAGIPEMPDEPGARDALIEGEAQAMYAARTGEDPSLWLAVHAPLPNVWLGVSVEDQARADERIPILLDTPAAVRWISAEPLLGPVDLRPYMPNALWNNLPSWKQPELDWVVAGGESGPGARAMHPGWARQIRNDCRAAGVPFLFKQWGEWTPFKNAPAGGRYPVFVFRDGRWAALDDEVLPDVDADGLAFRVGKKAAGRALDGVIHDAYPETHA